jgi:hypothetical protein
VPPRQVQQSAVAGEFEAEQGIAVLESLRPLGPAAGRVAAGNGDDRRAIEAFQRWSKRSVFSAASSSARWIAGNKSFAFKVN